MIRVAAAMAALALACGGASAEPIKIGVIKLAASGPIFLAQEKGYFAAEGVPAELVYFQAGEAVAVAAVSRDIDFGACGSSGGLYSLAGQGALRIIAGGYKEQPGWKLFAFVASNRAHDAGLKTFPDLAGHSVAVTTVGSPTHYSLALVEEKFHLDPASVRLLPLQSIPNVLSAVVGGQADVGILNSTGATPNIEAGKVNLIGWAGDVIPWQLAVTFTATQTATGRRDTVERFLRAYKKGARDYHDAFTGADGKRADGPTAAVTLAIIGKYLDQPVEQVARSISYVDADERLDVGDVLHQVGWYRGQNMIKGSFDPESVIDKSYAVALPAE